jgi:hypothetical protein
LLHNNLGLQTKSALVGVLEKSTNLKSICGFATNLASAHLTRKVTGTDVALLACSLASATSLAAVDVSKAICSPSVKRNLQRVCRKHVIELVTMTPNLPRTPNLPPTQNLPAVLPAEPNQPAVQAVPVVGAQPPVALAQQPAARALVPAVLAEPDQPPVLAIPVVAPQPPTAGAAVVALKVLLDGHCIAQAGCLGTFEQAHGLPDSCGRPVYKNGEHYLFFFGARWLVGPEDALGTGTYALMYAEDAALSPVDITAVWQEIVGGEWAAAPGVTVRDVATVLRAGTLGSTVPRTRNH